MRSEVSWEVSAAVSCAVSFRNENDYSRFFWSNLKCQLTIQTKTLLWSIVINSRDRYLSLSSDTMMMIPRRCFHFQYDRPWENFNLAKYSSIVSSLCSKFPNAFRSSLIYSIGNIIETQGIFSIWVSFDVAIWYSK